MQLYGKKMINWKGLAAIPSGEQRAKILEAVSACFKRVAEMPLHREKMVGADPALAGTAPIVQTFTDTIDTPDRGYEVLFDEVDMTSSTSKFFEIMGVNGGVTFHQQVPGEEAKLSKLPTSAKAAVEMIRFTGGFPILDDWLTYNEHYKIDDLTADTVKRWFDQKATLFYGLLTLLDSSINQAFDSDDVTTINKACASIITTLSEAGYAVDENSSFYITCHPNLKQRIYKALAAGFLVANSNSEQIVWPIKGVISTAKIPATSYYVSLPGLKNKRGEWDVLNARPAQRNELKLGADHVWTGAYNGAIGEKLQHKRCFLA